MSPEESPGSSTKVLAFPMESLSIRGNQDNVVEEDATAIDFPFKPKVKKTLCE